MSDQDNQQENQQPEESTSLFHDLGQHLAHAYQKFLDAKKEYGEANPPQSAENINAGKISPISNIEPPVIGSGAQPINLTPQESAQLSPLEQQQVAQSVPQSAPQQPVMIPQSVQQSMAPQSLQQPQPDAGAGSAGLPGPLKAQSNLAKASEDVGQGIQEEYNKGLDAQKQLVNDTQQHFQENLNQDRALMQAYMDKKIDPNAVINGMSTGKKIMTSLGLLFSGIGSGLTGEKNLALEMINNNIARDLEAQKASMGQAYNAYQMHREGTKDEFTADLQHQKDNLIAIDAAIEQQKAKLIGPQAIAAATHTQLGIKNQILELNQKSAMWNATKQSLANISNEDPSGKIRAMQLTGQINPGQAEQAYKELDRVQNHEKQKQAILGSFDTANKENTIAGRAAHLGAAPASVAAIQNQLMPYLKDAEGRINETEIKRTDKLIPEPGDSPHKVSEKRKALEAFMEEKSGSSLLKGLGVEPKHEAAKEQVKSMGGKQYRKVPGGWVPVQ